MPNETKKDIRPYHIRLWATEFSFSGIETQVDDAINKLYDKGVVAAAEARSNIAIRNMVRNRIILNHAIDMLRTRLNTNPTNSPSFVQWNNDLLDIIKAINNA